MNEETLEALKQSIEVWEGKLKEENPENIKMGAGYCPLCQIFNRSDYFCNGCPVYARTNSRFCGNTPYVAAAAAVDSWGNCPDEKRAIAYKENARYWIQHEIDFLKSLLPTTE